MAEKQIDSTLVCPKCGSKMKYNSVYDYYYCVRTFMCAYQIGYSEQTYGLNKTLKLGKIKSRGDVSIKVNTSNGTCIIFEDHYSGAKQYGPYQICDLNVDVKSKVETIYSASKGVAPMIAGGILFGSIGAVAGSMAGSTKSKQIDKEIYYITFTVNDDEYTGFRVEIKDYNIVHDFVTTLENIRKKLNPESTKEIIADAKPADDGDVFEKLNKIKQLFDNEIISKEEYEELRTKYLKLL
jgi:hypothetical protein